MLASGHLIQHRPKREQIGSRIEILTSDLLGRHISNRAQRGARTGERFFWQRSSRLGRSFYGFGDSSNCRLVVLGQSKIKNLHLPACRDENVGWFDVTVNDA